eukprot:17181_1
MLPTMSFTSLSLVGLIIITISTLIEASCQCQGKELAEGMNTDSFCNPIGNDMTKCASLGSGAFCTSTPTTFLSKMKTYQDGMFKITSQRMVDLKASGETYRGNNFKAPLADSEEWTIDNEIFISADKCSNVIEFEAQSGYFDKLMKRMSAHGGDLGHTFNNKVKNGDIRKVIATLYRGSTTTVTSVNSVSRESVVHHTGCTAFAISPYHFATAAHCLFDGENLIDVTKAKLIFPTLHDDGSASVELDDEHIADGYAIDWIIANKHALNAATGDISYDYGVIKILDSYPPMTRFWQVGYHKDGVLTNYLHMNGFRTSGFPKYAQSNDNAALVTIPLRFSSFTESSMWANQDQDPLRLPMYYNGGMSGGPCWHEPDDEVKPPFIVKHGRMTKVPIVRGVQSGIVFHGEQTGCGPSDQHEYKIDGSTTFNVCPVQKDRIVRINKARFLILHRFADRHGTVGRKKVAREEIRDMYPGAQRSGDRLIWYLH